MARQKVQDLTSIPATILFMPGSVTKDGKSRVAVWLDRQTYNKATECLLQLRKEGEVVATLVESDGKGGMNQYVDINSQQA